MKKKILLTTMTVMTVVLTALAATFSKTKVSDDCAKGCKIKEFSYNCGKCGSSMSSSMLETGSNGKNKYEFTCSSENCKHSCIYWVQR